MHVNHDPCYVKEILEFSSQRMQNLIKRSMLDVSEAVWSTYKRQVVTKLATDVSHKATIW